LKYEYHIILHTHGLPTVILCSEAHFSLSLSFNFDNSVSEFLSLTCVFPLFSHNEERLWTPYDKLAKDPREVTARLARFRCLLNQRGVAAAPLAGPGRVAPVEPGSCYSQ
jgi:hypothetical protein